MRKVLRVGKDACVTPVLELNEVDQHPYNKERELLISIDGVLQPIPAPRLSKTPGSIDKSRNQRGWETGDILEEIGYSSREITDLYKDNIVE